MSTSDHNANIKALWETSARAGSWLSERQKQALEAFSSTGFPTQRLEDWKYTDVRKLADHYPEWLGTAAADTSPELPLLNIDNAIHIAFVDGQYRADCSRTAELPAGLYAGPLGEAGNLKDRFGQLATDTDSGFVALNTAFAADGFALILEAGQRLEQPVYLSFYSSTPKITVQPRLLIDLGTNAEATVIEHYAGHTAGIINTVTEIRCGQNSRLTWDKLQDEHPDAWHIAVQYAELARDATLRTTQIDTGAAMARNEMRLKLAGPGAHAEARGLFMADERRHVESRITVEHAAPNTTSRERFRCILADRARGVFNGRILVQQAAQKTSADLTNRNLLLSAGAEINTKPELEIYADDVKCAHGSTTGQLDETALFYLLSRGIDMERARAILITAFASELITDIGIPALNDRVQEALSQLGRNDTNG